MLTRDKLIRALRARGKSDQLAQMAADLIERLCETAHPEPTPAPGPDGIFLTERVLPVDIYETPMIPPLDVSKKPPAKKAPAKKAKR